MGRGSSGRKGRANLRPLASNVMGAPRVFHETMNSKEARGANKILFTSDMKESPFIRSNWANAYAEGSWEILVGGDRIERAGGMITTVGDWLIGIQGNDENGYAVTDIKTGTLVVPHAASVSDATYAAGILVDGTVKKASLERAEERFRNAHR